ncbi:hypothetical protein DRN75_01340 [Nanoarchaeota archaeon]|nr:MAG: hypothetical protein DRN75_01340 [Nanoarchaeota archaeon]
MEIYAQHRAEIERDNASIEFSKFYDWFSSLSKGMGYSLKELKNKQKQGKSKEVEIELSKKLNEYVMFVIEVMISYDIKDRKYTIKINGKMITDYMDKWEINPFVKFVKSLYEYITATGLTRYSGQLKDDVDFITNECKMILGMEHK